MAQVGRISGPLLEANLVRQGTSNNTSQDDLKFKNTNSDTTLLKVDVTNGRIGVDVEAPAVDLQISQHTHTTDLIVDNSSSIANFEISSNNINVNNGNIFLNAGEAIVLSNLETEQFFVTDNYISTNNTNTDIDLKFNGTGELIITTNLEVFGDLHSKGNVTFDGNITFGDADTDTVDFNADVVDSLVPDVTDTYDLGSASQRWKTLNTSLVNGQLLNTGLVNVDGIFLESRQGNIFYVAKGGDDANVGDHPNSPVLTIQRALALCDASTDGPVTILVYPGEYEETCPLVVPDRVSIRGVDIRNVVIKPTVATQDKDIFHLNDSCLISNLTIKDYFYNSIDNTGYAFRFTPNAVITNRSPYVQDITVITKGSVTSASDPRGFNEGDAGRGAWIDGAELNSASIEASFLFHSATFICPNADVINMTNGVRVEWLNSFTYFANRGLYAFNGITGRTTYDGSTIEYGAELRSIGSANVYGNYGAVADGADTLMYLIQHNMGYIGAGKFVDNDASRAIYANEIVELNSGTIHFTTTDHLGGFRIGDNFFVDFETGNTTINLDTLTVNQFNALRVTTGADTTVIDGAFIETGNLTIANTTIQSNTGDLNIAGSTGTINLQDNTNISGNLDISGDFSYGGTFNIKGDEATDSLTFNTALDQNFNPNVHQTYKLGSFEKKWLTAHLNRLETPDINIYNNVIESVTSNADLDIRANGTGSVRVTNSATFSNALTVNGTTTINDNVDITDDVFSITGDVNQTGNFSVTQDVTVDQNINVGASAEFEEILVDANVITTTTSNADLELRASGTGTVNLQETVNVANSLSSRNTTATGANITLNTATDNANIGNVEINDNYIETTSINGDLTLSADRNVVVTGTDVNLAQDLTVQGATDLQALDITGTLAHTGAYNQTGNYTIGGELTVDNVYVEDNFITTTLGDLTLEATGNIVADTNNVSITNNLDVDGVTNLDITDINGTLTQVGDTTQTGNYDIAGELTVDNVYVEDNFITTTLGDLTLGATGDINVDANNVEIAQDLTVSGATDLQTLTITGALTHVGDTVQTGNLDIAGEISNGNILIEDNVITSTNTNSDLELRANSTGEVVIDSDDSLTIDNNLFVGGTLDYQGTLTINGDVILQGNTQDGSLTVTENFDVTGTLDISSQAQFEDIRIEDNFVTTTQSNSDLELRAADTGEVLIPNNNVQVNNNLFTASISTGDINVNDDLVLDELVITDSNIEINENYITSKTSNADLELRATGNIIIQETAILSQDLTVNTDTDLQSTNVNGTLTHIGDRTQTGDYTLTGNLNLSEFTIDSAFQVDDFRISGNVFETTLSNSNLDLRASGTGKILFNENVQMGQNLTVGSFNVGSISVNNDVTFEEIELSTDIQFEDNYITTTNSNSNLELRASGTGSVYLQQVEFNDNSFSTASTNIVLSPSEDLIVNSTSVLQIPKGDTSQRVVAQDEFLDGGVALNSGTILDGGDANTVFGAGDTIYNSGGAILSVSGNTGDIRFNTDDNVFEGTSTSTITFNGIYSTDRQTSVTADPTSNNIRFIVNGAASPLDSSNLVGEVTGEGLTVHGLQVDDILLDNNVITTNVSNSNLDLSTNGTGELVLDDLFFKSNLIKNDGNNLIIKHTGFGHAKAAGTFGVVVPSGTTITPTPNPQIGDTRWNTSEEQLETWNGTQYLVATGIAAAITPQEFDDLLLEYTIIFG